MGKKGCRGFNQLLPKRRTVPPSGAFLFQTPALAPVARPGQAAAMLISSTGNDEIKAARQARDGHDRGLLFVEGERLVRDCLGSAAVPRVCFHAPDPPPAIAALLPRLSERGARLLPTAPAVLKSLSDTVSPQGIIVLAARPPSDADAFWRELPACPLLVALDRVQDPGNLGAILRTAEAAGAHGLIALNGTADPFAPKVLRASMGSAFRLPILTGLTPNSLLAAARARSLRAIAAAGGAAASYRDIDWTVPALLVLGNEGSGLDPALLAACAETVRIPIKPPVESLNVAAAAAVLLFEAAHQRAVGG